MRPALVVIDMQKCFLEGKRSLHPSLDDAVPLINHVASVFRTAGLPVAWVHDAENIAPQDPAFAMWDTLDVQPGDGRVHKVASNAFAEPALPDLLDSLGVDFALLCGYRAEQCVLSTARGAADRGLRHALLRGAVVGTDPEAPAFVERISPLLSREVAEAMAQGHK